MHCVSLASMPALTWIFKKPFPGSLAVAVYFFLFFLLRVGSESLIFFYLAFGEPVVLLQSAYATHLHPLLLLLLILLLLLLS